MFSEKRPLSKVALSILQKRYFNKSIGESSWLELTDRVCNFVLRKDDLYDLTRDMIYNRYFVPNSPCLVNANSKINGLLACYVVDFKDSIEEIYQTKLDFALIARKGGGCGTTLSHIRPRNSTVCGSTHGYAGGPIAFADTISHDMAALTQSGFRGMAIMLVMSIYHPDILEFINAKQDEGKIANANISVMVDDAFLEKVRNDETYQTYFDFEDGRVYYDTLNAREVFRKITDAAWKNGEPGIINFDRVNNSPYKYTGQVIYATNPCAEQPLPPGVSCNLGSIDVSKYYDTVSGFNWKLFALSIKLGVRFLDQVIDKTSFPSKKIEETTKKNRPIGLGIMGFADLLLAMKIRYGSKDSIEVLRSIMKFMYEHAEQESILLGQEYGVPEYCQMLPVPRRNITVVTVAPTGTVSLIAGCNSGIEPVYSEITVRNDTTGSYEFIKSDKLWEEDYFSCAVSANGAREVTPEEHLLVLNAAQEFNDSGTSKTINVPQGTHRDTVFDLFLYGLSLPYVKAFTLYRSGSRSVEVLTPKNVKKDKCPQCGKDLEVKNGCRKCPDPNCGFSVCEMH